MNNIRIYIFIICLIVAPELFSQQKEKREAIVSHPELFAADFPGLFKAYIDKSNENSEDNTELAIAWLDSALSLSVKFQDAMRIAQVHESLGNLYFKNNIYYLALENFQKAFEVMIQSGNSDSASGVLIGIGNIYQVHKLNHVAENYYKKAIRLLSDKKKIIIWYQYYIGMAGLFQERNELNMELNFLDSAYRLISSVSQRNLIAETYLKIAQVKISQGNLIDALSYLTEAEQMLVSVTYLKRSETKLLGQIYIQTGNCYEKLKLFPDALKNFRQAVLVSEKTESGLEAAYKIASILLITKNTREAFEIALNGYTNSKNLRNYVYLKKMGMLLSHICEQKGDLLSSLDYARSVSVFNDSLNSDKLSSKLAELKSIVDVADLEARIKIQEQTINTDRVVRNTLIGGAVLILLTAVLLTYGFIKLRKSNRILKEKNLQIIYSEKELMDSNEIKNRLLNLVAHDLRNPFNSLINISQIQLQELKGMGLNEIENYSRIIHDSALRAYQLLENLLTYSRLQLNSIVVKKAPMDIGMKIDNLINQVRSDAVARQIKIEKKTDGSWGYTDVEIFNTVIKTLLLNAIRFSPSQTVVTIQTHRKRDFVQIEISDSGEIFNEQDIDNLLDLKYNKISSRSGRASSGFSVMLSYELSKLAGAHFLYRVNELNQGVFIVEIPLYIASISKNTGKMNDSPESKNILNYDEKAYMRSWISDFRTHEIYELSALNRCLENLDPGDFDAIADWKKEMAEAIYISDENKFNTLIEIATLKEYDK